ncbi:hypothetical protein PsorP6_016603 [Peronosclerospora sorghi]|uniref:Uncharacterized protein n=1 Tax=Peronosclerospora sorghi TaxID=230839 RepID=A0ACC0VN41_9STRA|nr:hypothetical protein PsorP6_016603 [Peronosclerospora sorghi]
MGTVTVAELLGIALEEVIERRIPDLNIGVGVPFGVVVRTRVACIGTEGVEHTESSRRPRALDEYAGWYDYMASTWVLLDLGMYDDDGIRTPRALEEA